jgi:hypothetical protein
VREINKQIRIREESNMFTSVTRKFPRGIREKEN